MIRDCEASREIWEHFSPPHLINGFFFSEMDLQAWLAAKLKWRKTDPVGNSWPETMGIICWNLWKWRNSELFNNDMYPLTKRLEIIRESMEETTQAWKRGSATVGGSSVAAVSTALYE